MSTQQRNGVALLHRMYEQYVKPVEQDHLDEYVLATPEGEMIFASDLTERFRKTEGMDDWDNCTFKVGEIAATRLAPVISAARSARFPYVPVHVRLGSLQYPDYECDVDALVDTGFEGGLSVPRALIPERVNPSGVQTCIVDFLRARDEQRELVQAAAVLSEPSLADVWDNAEDDVYNDL